jgi:hypothetical protein
LEADKDLLREEEVHSEVAEHVREAGGCLGAREDLLREEEGVESTSRKAPPGKN